MKNEKEIEALLRETLEPPRKAVKQEREVQSEVDKLLDERLSEFKPERIRSQSLISSDTEVSSPESTSPEETAPSESALFTNYAAQPQPSRKLRFIIMTVLAICITAGSIGLIIKSSPKAVPPPESLRVTASTSPTELRSSTEVTPQIEDGQEPESDPIPENPTDISVSDPEALSFDPADSEPSLPPIEDEFLLEIEIPNPSLLESSLGNPEFSDPNSDPIDSPLTITDRPEAAQEQTEASSPPLKEPPIPQESPPTSPSDEAPSGAPVPLEALDAQPEVLRRTSPTYPAGAFRRGIEGTVVINALISESGRVLQTKILRTIKGPFGFDQACIEAVRQWRFEPAIKDGEHVKVWKPISITFKKK